MTPTNSLQPHTGIRRRTLSPDWGRINFEINKNAGLKLHKTSAKFIKTTQIIKKIIKIIRL